MLCYITQAQQCRYTSQVDIFSYLTYHKCLFFHLKIISYNDGNTDAWISYRKDGLHSDHIIFELLEHYLHAYTTKT